jgi:integrase
VVPLNQDAYSALTKWRQCFGNPLPCHSVFPSERYGLDGNDGYKQGSVTVWNLYPDKPIGSWKVAWGACRKLGGVECRLHDVRHTFVSRLAERQTSDQTVMALAGHMSRKMIERYSRARNEAKRLAVDSLNMGGIRGASPQFPPQ